MVIILDLGGVLMRHNMPECLARFERLLGKEQMAQVLGLQSNAEGTLDSLVDRYEKGDISTDTFVDTILAHSYEGATREEVVAAWNSMHGGIPEERLQLIQRWADAGHHLYMLSNNNDLHWHHVFSNYDLSMFRHCYASHLLHLAKPDPRIYQAVDQAIRKQEDLLGTSRLCRGRYNQPFYFVDDLEANRLPAEQLGWQTFASLEELAELVPIGRGTCPDVSG
ncbi:MAG: hypothetical protein SOT07_05525 [Paludibacteraceae bacterium]|nr:hypothetical protein [Paludibacteraceae bacterium]